LPVRCVRVAAEGPAGRPESGTAHEVPFGVGADDGLILGRERGDDAIDPELELSQRLVARRHNSRGDECRADVMGSTVLREFVRGAAGRTRAIAAAVRIGLANRETSERIDERIRVAEAAGSPLTLW
jgi:hypothetical protein